MIDRKTFGSFMKAKRIEKNYSQRDLAEMLFVTESAVSKWERGVSYPDITLISDICHVLDLSEHELITASTDMDTRKMKQEARKFHTIRDAWLLIPTKSYGIALITCFICNLAVNHTLSWFFVVLAALLCAFTFVPTFTGFFETNMLLAFSVSTALSICLLLFTCAAYTGDLSWFLTAAIGVMMGYAAMFAPVLLKRTPYARYTYILTFTVLFLLTVLMLMYIRIRHVFLLGNAILLAAYNFIPVIACAAVCVFQLNAFLKAGICTTVIGITLYCENHVIASLFGPSANNPYQVDFQSWEQCMSGNVQFLTLMLFLVVSILFFMIGIFGAGKNKRQ